MLGLSNKNIKLMMRSHILDNAGIPIDIFAFEGIEFEQDNTQAYIMESLLPVYTDSRCDDKSVMSEYMYILQVRCLKEYGLNDINSLIEDLENVLNNEENLLEEGTLVIEIENYEESEILSDDTYNYQNFIVNIVVYNNE